jgi:hypothetical protein
MRQIKWWTFVFLVATLAISFGEAEAQNQPDEQNSAFQTENQFLQGLAALNSGNAAASIPIFRSILATDPSLVRVRLELARAYFLVEQWRRSRTEFYTVLSADLPDEVRENVMGYIQAIDGRRGFDWDMAVGLVSVGNQRSYDSDEILLDFGGGALPFNLDRASSGGIGMRVTAAAKFRKQLSFLSSENTIATGSIETFVDLVDAENTFYDDATFGIRSALRFSGRELTYSIAPVVTARLLAGIHFENAHGFDVAFEKRTPKGLSYFGTGGLRNIDNKISNDLDGNQYSLSLGVRQAFAGRGFFGAALFIERNDVEFNLDNYQELGVRIFASIDIKFGLTIKPSITFATKTFPQPSPVFTADPDEKSITVSARIEKNDIFWGDGFSPFLDVSYKKTKSGISAFSYDEKYFQLGFQRNF